MARKGIGELERRFLGVKTAEEVHVLENQKANEERQAHAYETMLLREACEFGDSLVRYIMGHYKLSAAQRAWAVVLGTLNVRGDYPGGTEEFDELADRGGEQLQLDNVNIVDDDEEKQRIVQELPQFTQEQYREAAAFAEAFSRYIGMKRNQLGTDRKQTAYGLGRAFHNLRLTFPMEGGGTAAFDELARRAGDYFDRYKDS